MYQKYIHIKYGSLKKASKIESDFCTLEYRARQEKSLHTALIILSNCVTFLSIMPISCQIYVHFEQILFSLYIIFIKNLIEKMHS